MKNNRKRISPKTKYEAVLEVMSGNGTFEKIARKYNMSVTTLWNYNASADAAIRKVFGLQSDCIPYNESKKNHERKNAKSKTVKKDNKSLFHSNNEVLIRVKIET